MLAIHSSGQTIFGVTHVESITLGVGEVVDEVTGGASDTNVIRTRAVGDKTSEG